MVQRSLGIYKQYMIYPRMYSGVKIEKAGKIFNDAKEFEYR